MGEKMKRGACRAIEDKSIVLHSKPWFVDSVGSVVSKKEAVGFMERRAGAVRSLLSRAAMEAFAEVRSIEIRTSLVIV
jgi:hypothetical protein